ncbi:5-(carboxyamino)imidazole ribonucleotide synthase [Altererythrobacter sp.]|uniref:5-(carboxyamino)imidazole ribonucleotide synthase n=1 Tax=Altererythrobacter sp. TaxID=1872480 RepID=UPI003D06D619
MQGPVIKPGSTIGILGGGQLGRMMAMAAAQLGYRCIGYAPAGENVAADVCHDFFENGWGDKPALSAFASKCDVVTWEFENVPLSAVEMIPPQLLHPDPRALEVAQDRLKEKRFVEGLGGTPAPYAPVDSESEFRQAVERIGTPGILKTCREGYDGKGQWRLKSDRDLESVRFPGRSCVYEGYVPFDAEFSVILLRGLDGEIRFWDSPENRHEGGILIKSSVPASDHVAPHVDKARRLARKVAEALNYVGVLTLEFFATADGPVFNEMAPRVHNSGHWTIEGADTSQFENHIRAICGLPLGDCGMAAKHAAMTNLIGEQIFESPSILSDPHCHVHVYGKSEAREGRKMGHVTRLER